MNGPNEVQVGVFLSPHASGLDQLAAKVATAETAGFDYVSIQDHPYVSGYLDTFALIAYLAARTDRLRFMTNVANLPLRPAPMLAKTSASIDLLSGGRFELGLGGGRAWDQIFGSAPRAGARGRPSMRPARRSTPCGHCGPRTRSWNGPVDTTRWPVWPAGLLRRTGSGSGLGAAGPHMLDLLGRKADGWIAPLSTGFETKPAGQDRIDAAARAAGRSPTAIRRVIQLVGTVTDTPGTTPRPRSGAGNTPIRATPEDWAQTIAGFGTEQRFDTINFVHQHETTDQLRRFGTDVIPRARAAIQAESA